MLPKSRDKRIDYEVEMPKPPQPRRRGTMEFYEWIVLFLFLASLGFSAASHMVLNAENFGIKEDVDTLLFPDFGVIFFFILLIWFDYAARVRYTKYSSQLFDQWQEDKIRFMKMNTEDMEKKAKAISEDNESE